MHLADDGGAYGSVLWGSDQEYGIQVRVQEAVHL